MFSAVMTPVALNLYRNRGGESYAMIVQAVHQLLQYEAKMQLKLFDMTVRTWRSKPEFFSTIDDGDPMLLTVGTGDKVYFFLDRGTRVRRAVMSEGFVPKTTPGSLRSGRGNGKRVYYGPKINLPGIEARHFTDTIYDQRRPIHMSNFKKYIVPYATRLLFGDQAGPAPNRFWR